MMPMMLKVLMAQAEMQLVAAMIVPVSWMLVIELSVYGYLKELAD